MEEERIKEWFTHYNPILSDSSEFMKRLEEKMKIVEMIKKYERAQQRSNWGAIAIAAVAGFITGVIFMTLLPWLKIMVGKMLQWLSFISITELPQYASLILLYGLIAASTFWVTFNAYDISLKLLNPKPFKILPKH